MKRLIMLISALAFFAVSAAAQDFVTKRNGEDIAAIVDEVGPDYVRFRLWDEPEGVTYTMLKNEILMIRYATGRNEVFDQKQSLAMVPMKYKEMAEVYDFRLYQKSPFDIYSPAGSGIASFFIPGLGQMICGEWGRGFAWLGGQVGCYMLAGISAGTDSDTLMLMSLAGMLTIRIATIVDGVRVAKVKNMYMEDLRKSGYYGLDVDLYPSVNYVHTASGVQPTAGMTLALRF